MNETPDQTVIANSSDYQVDEREQLFNYCQIGPITEVSRPKNLITRVCAIMFDIDPALYCTSRILPKVSRQPKEFYHDALRVWLGRHPVLAKGQVRKSGTGLHVLLRFSEPVDFLTEQDRDRWDAQIKVIQASLPIDPNQPSITSLTRPIGSINGKNGSTVELLAAGDPVSIDEVHGLFDEMAKKPYSTVSQILFGTDRQTPCPLCGINGTTLSASNTQGQCYKCGKVTLEDLYALVYTAECKEASSNG